MTESRSGQTSSPWNSSSSPVLPTTTRSSGGTTTHETREEPRRSDSTRQAHQHSWRVGEAAGSVGGRGADRSAGLRAVDDGLDAHRRPGRRPVRRRARCGPSPASRAPVPSRWPCGPGSRCGRAGRASSRRRSAAACRGGSCRRRPGVEATAGVAESLLQLAAANLRLLVTEHSEADGDVAGVGQGLANLDLAR